MLKTDPQFDASQGTSARPAGWLRRDIIAGLTVAVVELPQSMAYALIAGVAPVYGIYASVIQGLLGAVLSDNRHIRTGPTNTQALLVASAVAQLGQLGGHQFLVVVATLTFVKGVLQIAAGLLRAGALFRFVSPSTIMGISAGAGILIIAGQLPNFLGMTLQGKSGLPGLTGLIDSVRISGWSSDWRAVLIGLTTLAAMVFLPRRFKRFPTALFCVGLSTLLVWGMKWGDLATVKEIPRQWPELVIPFSTSLPWVMLLSSAAALAVLGMIETVAIARTLGDSPEPSRADAQPLARDTNRELWAQGVSNLASSAVGAIPGSASFSRSMLDHVAGSATRFSGVVNAVGVAVLALVFAPLGAYLPLSVLAGILIAIAWRLVDFSFIRRVRKCHRADFAVFLVSMLATLFVPLQYAVFIGILVNLAYQLRVASRLRAVELTLTSAGQFRELTGPAPADAEVRILQLDGNLFFALRDELAGHLETLADSGAKVHILRLRNTHAIDVSILDCIGQHVQRMQRSGGHVLLCGIRAGLMSVLQSHPHITDPAGENLFPVDNGVFESLQRAIDRAKQIGARVAPSPAEPPWVYVI